MKLSRPVDQLLQKIKDEMNLQSCEWVILQKSAVKLLIEASETLHLPEDEELIDFAFMGIKYGSRFKSQPEFIAALGDLSSGKLRWFSLKERIETNCLR